MTPPPAVVPIHAPSRLRAVLLTAGYALIAQSLFAALAALLVGASLDAGFRHISGGLLGALAMPGAPHALEGLLPFFYDRALGWVLPVLGLAALLALVAPLLEGAWLAGLAGQPALAALRVGLRTYATALRLRVLLVVPFAAALVITVLLSTYARLVFRAEGDRSADLALLAGLGLGAWCFTWLRVLVDLAHAALVRAALRGEPVGARLALADGLRSLRVGSYLCWFAATALGLALLALGSILAAGLGDWLAVLVTQLAAYLRYASRGAWLAVALGSGRFGSVTRKSAPPVASSALPAEMVPP